MKYKIPNTYLEIDQQTLDLYIDGKNVTKYYVKNNMYLIKIHKFNMLREKEWFLHLAVLKLNIPIKYSIVYTKIKFMPTKHFGISKDNYGFLPVLKTPFTIKVNNDIFRMLIRYPRYFISKNGKVYDSSRDCFLSPRYSLMVYPTIYIQDQASSQKCVFLHKLVALAWVNNNDYLINYVVDHIDNNKLNFYYKNLQWCSPSSNISKRRSGELIDNIIVRNIETGEITKYPSMKTCSEELFSSRIDTKNSSLRFGKIWTGKNGKYEIYRMSGFKKWAFINKPAKTYKFVITVNEKHDIYFSTLTEMQKYFGLPTRNNLNKTLNLMNKLGNNVYKLKECFNAGKYLNKNIYVYDTVTKTITIFPKVIDVVGFLRCSQSLVWKLLRTNRYDHLIKERYLISIDKNLDFSKINPKLPDNFKKKIIATSNNSEEIIFDSLGALKSVLNVDYRTIHKYICNNKKVLINNKEYLLQYKKVPLYSNV